MGITLLRLLTVVCLALLLVVAGCTAIPFGESTGNVQDRPVQLVLNNSANVTQTFEVAVVEAGANATVRRRDGRTVNWTIERGLRTHDAAKNIPFTAVEPPASARFHRDYTLASGEVKETPLEDFPQDAVVLVVLRQGETIGWWATAGCGDGALVGLSVTSRPSKYGDAWAGYRCQDSLF